MIQQFKNPFPRTSKLRQQRQKMIYTMKEMKSSMRVRHNKEHGGSKNFKKNEKIPQQQTNTKELNSKTS